MAVYLHEMQAGCDRQLIGFPDLRICNGVVLQTGHWVYGFHFDHPVDAQANANAFNSFFLSRGGSVANGVHLYGCADWTIRYNGAANPENAWRAEMQMIAATLNYHGRVSGFDTGILAPLHGTYVEYQPNYPAERSRIFYKRGEHIGYVTTTVMGNTLPRLGSIAGFRHNINAPMSPAVGSVMITHGAAVPGGILDEVDYSLRLISFNV